MLSSSRGRVKTAANMRSRRSPASSRAWRAWAASGVGAAAAGS